jgi:hypothetical protein
MRRKTVPKRMNTHFFQYSRRVLIFLPLPALLAAVCDRVIFLAVLLILPRLPVTMLFAWLRHLAKLVTFAGPPVTLIRNRSIAFACRYADASVLSDIYYPLSSSCPVQITSPPKIASVIRCT